MRKATINFTMCVSVRPSAGMGQFGSHWTDFYEILYLSIFKKTIEKNQVSLKYDNKNCTLRNNQYTFLIMCCSVFLKMRNIQAQVVQTIKTHI
jgi:hypothetical protein